LFKEIKKLISDRFKIKLIDDSDIKIDIKNGANDSNRWHLESVRFGLKSSDFYRENHFDLVITHFSTDLLFIPSNIKTILNVHGVPSFISSIDENCYSLANNLIFTTNDIKDKICKMYPCINKNGRVIHLGTKNIFDTCPILERKNDILFVGRLIKIKGIDILISAIKRLPSFNRINVCIVGMGPEENNLKELVKSYGLEKNIRFISSVSEEELSQLYLNSKIVVFPSYQKEGILLSMLEAAAHGCGLIVSNCCGMPEFIENGKNGLLFEPKNIEDLSNKINLLMNDKDKRNELGYNAFIKIRDYWNDLERTKELYNYYLEVKNE